MHSKPWARSSFIISLLELKLDYNMTFTWKSSAKILRARHSTQSYWNFSTFELKPLKPVRLRLGRSHAMKHTPLRGLKSTEPLHPSLRASETATNCVMCKFEKHPLYACISLKSLPHDKMIATIQSNGLHLNCLKPVHLLWQCSSFNRCRKCQKPHSGALRTGSSCFARAA